MAKLGPGSVAIVFGTVLSSNLVGSNLDFIDYNTHSWPFLVPGIWTKKTKMQNTSRSTSMYTEGKIRLKIAPNGP